MSASPSCPSCRVAAITYHGYMAFCRPKGNYWTIFNDKENFYYLDLIFHKGAPYAVNSFGELCVFEFDTYPRCRTVLPPLIRYMVIDTHLVECNGELLAVLRLITSDGIGFQIYRADLGEKKWVAVKSLGSDQVLFLQWKYSLALKAGELEGFKGDCIYYKAWPIQEAKVYEIQTRQILPYTGRVFPRIWIVPTAWELGAES